MFGSTLIYSKRFGLVLFGGQKDRKCVLNLSFHRMDECDEMDPQKDTMWSWEWTQLCGVKEGMMSKDMACTMINDKTALIMGGTNKKRNNTTDTKSVDIFDFEMKEWIPLRQSKYARSRAGIAYDRNEKRVYCVGGSNLSFPVNKVEYLDLAKNQWIRLPNTTEKHSNWPLVWKDPHHRDVLMVASYYANSLESYDLRESWKLEATRQYESGWSMVYGPEDTYPMYDKCLKDVFRDSSCLGYYKREPYKFNGRLLRFSDDYL